MAERFRNKLMQNAELYPGWAQVDPRFGPVSGVTVGNSWESRKECSNAGVHSRLFAGISGTPALGAFSIVLSGGYEDDSDEGETFVYTGTGGQADSFSGSGPQTSDQSFAHPDNSALRKSVETKRPVRVIRGPNPKSKYAPQTGYRYDGLYKVEKAYLDKGKRGFAVCKFELRREPGQPPLPRGDTFSRAIKRSPVAK